jgi:hypothetical protein
MLFDEKELVESEGDDEPKSKRGRDRKDMRKEEEGLSKMGSTTCFDVSIASCFSCVPTSLFGGWTRLVCAALRYCANIL